MKLRQNQVTSNLESCLHFIEFRPSSRRCGNGGAHVTSQICSIGWVGPKRKTLSLYFTCWRLERSFYSRPTVTTRQSYTTGPVLPFGVSPVMRHDVKSVLHVTSQYLSIHHVAYSCADTMAPVPEITTADACPSCTVMATI